MRSIPAVLLLLDDELYGSRFPVAAYGVTPLLARPTVAHSPGSQVEARVCMCMCSGPHGSARAACLSPAHQVEQSDPVHRAGTSAPIRSCVMCSAANVRDWAYWEKELEHWSTEDLLQSEHADEFVHMLQTRPGWQRISAAAERCYQAGATQVLLCGPFCAGPGSCTRHRP